MITNFSGYAAPLLSIHTINNAPNRLLSYVYVRDTYNVIHSDYGIITLKVLLSQAEQFKIMFHVTCTHKKFPLVPTVFAPITNNCGLMLHFGQAKT